MQADVFHLEANDEQYQSMICEVLTRHKKNPEASFRFDTSSSAVFKKFLLRHKPRQVVLTDYNDKAGCSFSLAPVTEKRKLLFIHRYRCPGPVIEIMTELRLLGSSEIMELVMMGDKVEADELLEKIASRGFRIENRFSRANRLVKCSIRKEQNHD